MAVVHTPDATTPASRALVGSGWWLIGLALLAMVLLSALGNQTEFALRYDRQRILNGDYWRLITGHWVHGGGRHMTLNVLGAVLISFLFVRTYSLRQWVLVLAASLMAIDIGFLYFETQLQWYVGASGVLHGALAAGAIAWLYGDRRTLRLLCLSLGARRLGTALRLAVRAATTLALWAIVLSKLGWEQAQGALPLMGDMAVIVNAHLYGAVGGGTVAIAIQLRAAYSKRKVQQAPL